MPRPPRCFEPGRVYHVLNRGVRRHCLFEQDDDYALFQRLMGAAQERVPLRLIAYCLMPNHWHLVVWPTDPEAVSAYMRWLTWSHACHLNSIHGLTGHVYQGRFRSVAVRDERQLLTLLRYVEGNAASAGLVDRAEGWRWSSLHRCSSVALCESPVRRPDDWLELLAGP